MAGVTSRYARSLGDKSRAGAARIARSAQSGFGQTT
ncbi:hypothetical protein HD596_006070 [Nonomuraea jabiensis]|uniref:Uncharacterized protein n=1 Tax=Nonomuraea jabiensis TaxID=882448 RepID=A0A7W9G8S0_9ACTN|nr:hypothetical protein [Nonomuraea jabiensis]